MEIAVYLHMSVSTCNSYFLVSFFFNDTATTEIYTLSLHDALPISVDSAFNALAQTVLVQNSRTLDDLVREMLRPMRSEEHTSELQSRQYLVCRLLLEKKNSCICM